MTRRAFQLVVPGLVMLPALAMMSGGWAVTTVEDLPDYVVAGKPVTLAFTVRQHGTKPVRGLQGKVEATAGSLKAGAQTTAGKAAGQYTATLTLPRAGEWAITIHNGFGKSSTTLLPVTAIDSEARAPLALADAERGRRLFVAKGCVTCHVDIAVGPDLNGKRFDAGYLSQFLADPKRVAPRSGSAEMPDLNLKPREITALVAYINGEKQVGAR